MFKRLTRLPLLIMSLILVLTVSTVAAHETTGDLNNPPALEKTTDKVVDGGRYPDWKHVVWQHAHKIEDWTHWDVYVPQSVEVEVGDVLGWSDLNHLSQTSGCVTTGSRSYSTTAIYGAGNDLVAENARELGTDSSASLSGDWGLSGEFTHVGTVYVYRVTQGFSGYHDFSCVMFEKYQFRVSE